MKKFTVKRYQQQDFMVWNEFIAQSKNATFLFHRDFMEYHRDRFEDFSLLIYENEKLVAILPANVVGTTVYSHQGLTYGGLVLLPSSKLYNTITIMQCVLQYLEQQNIFYFYLKQIPAIYCDYPSEEMDYLMFVCKAKVVMRHNVSVISLKRPVLVSKSRKECIRRGKKLNLTIKEETNFESFWNELLIPNLSYKYKAKPVHSLSEITNLQKKFPDNIRHFNVYNDTELVCGTTLFLTDKVAKPQYIAGNENNNTLGSIDFLYDFLIGEIAKEKEFFDMGPSHENQGLNIVKNINFWKESFGAHSVVQDFYEVETKNHSLLESILI